MTEYKNSKLKKPCKHTGIASREVDLSSLYNYTSPVSCEKTPTALTATSMLLRLPNPKILFLQQTAMTDA